MHCGRSQFSDRASVETAETGTLNEHPTPERSGYAEDVAQAVLHGDKRNFDEIAKDSLKAAAWDRTSTENWRNWRGATLPPGERRRTATGHPALT